MNTLQSIARWPFMIALRSVVNLVRFPYALLRFRLYRQTVPWGHQALVQLFCASGGRFNDWISSLISLRSRVLELPHPVGLLGDLRGSALAQQTEILRKRGYVVFPKALPDDVCDRLMLFARETSALVRRMDHEPVSQPPRHALFDPLKPLAVRYDYPVDSLLNHVDVQALLADQSLLALAQSYLGSRPRADVLSMWWHTNFNASPDSEAAQFYHFDLDRIKWFKVFIYLTDVGPQEGPHKFIEGSHRTGGIPQSMLRRGYVRLSDEEVLGHFGSEREIEFSAPRGTVIVEDTRGLHKGKAVSGSSRLVLQLQFSNSLFGATYAKATIREPQNQQLKELITSASDVYSSYL
jgi:hypothetical protein